MSFFRSVYEFIVKYFTKAVTAAGIDFFAFIAIAVFMVFVVAGIIAMTTSREAKTARKLIKVNRLLLKNKKSISPSFNEEFDRLMKKGKDRVKQAYSAYLSDDGMRINEVFNDARLAGGYTHRGNLVKKATYIISFFFFVVAIGQFSVIENFTALSIYNALIIPSILEIISLAFGLFFNIYTKRVENVIIDYSAAISNHIAKFIDEPERSTHTPAADTIDADVLPLLNEEDYATEIAKLTDEKAVLEQQIDAEKQNLTSAQQKTENDIASTRKELVEVREQIVATDNVEKQQALKQQESSQVKLIAVLEKLKQTQQKHYDDAELKLQSELSKIEQMIEARKLRQQQAAEAEISAFAQEVKAAEVLEEVKPETHPKKDMNAALDNLINAMNRIEKDDK